MDPYSSNLLLRDTGLDPGTLQLLASNNLHSCQDLLLLSVLDLVELLNIPYSRAEWLLGHAAMHLAPSYTTVSASAAYGDSARLHM
jgi:hypothetical protein